MANRVVYMHLPYILTKLGLFDSCGWMDRFASTVEMTSNLVLRFSLKGIKQVRNIKNQALMANFLLRRRSSKLGGCFVVFSRRLITFLIRSSLSSSTSSSGYPAQTPFAASQVRMAFPFSCASSMPVGQGVALASWNLSQERSWSEAEPILFKVENGEMLAYFSKLLKSIKVENEGLGNQIYLINAQYQGLDSSVRLPLRQPKQNLSCIEEPHPLRLSEKPMKSLQVSPCLTLPYSSISAFQVHSQAIILKPSIQLYFKFLMSQKLTEDPNTKQLNQFVQNMLKQMQERFDEMSSNIIGRVDEMGKRIDDIEKSIGEIMNDLGEEEEHGKK